MICTLSPSSMIRSTNSAAMSFFRQRMRVENQTDAHLPCHKRGRAPATARTPEARIIEHGIYILLRKNAKANTVTTIFTTKAHAEIELSAPENAQMGAEAQAYSAFSPVNSIIYIWNHNFPCLCRKIVLYFATSKGSDKIVSLPLHIRNIDSVLKISYFGKTAERRRRKARWV